MPISAPQGINASDSLETGFRAKYNQSIKAIPNLAATTITPGGTLRFFNYENTLIGELALADVLALANHSHPDLPGGAGSFGTATDQVEGVGRIATDAEVAQAVEDPDNAEQFAWVTPDLLAYGLSMFQLRLKDPTDPLYIDGLSKTALEALINEQTSSDTADGFVLVQTDGGLLKRPVSTLGGGGNGSGLSGNLSDWADELYDRLGTDPPASSPLGYSLRNRMSALEGQNWKHFVWAYTPAGTATIYPPRYRFICQIPASSEQTRDHTIIRLEGGGWTVGSKLSLTIKIANRYGLYVRWWVDGANPITSPVAVVMHQLTNGAVNVYVLCPTSEYAAYSISAFSNQAVIDPNYPEVTTPDGDPDPVFNTADPERFPPSYHDEYQVFQFYKDVLMKKLRVARISHAELIPADSGYVFNVINPNTGDEQFVDFERLYLELEARKNRGTNAPVWSNITAQTITQGVAFSRFIGLATSATGNPFTVTASGLPAGVSYNAGTGFLSGTASVSPQNLTVTLTATDNVTSAASQITFPLTVVSAVRPLVVIAPSYNPVNGALTINTADGNGTAIEYRVMGLRDWGSSANFTIPDYQREGVRFTLEARQSGTIAQAFWTSYSNQANNRTPTAIGTVPTLYGTVALAFRYVLPTLFNDPDGDLLTLSASNLPAGLALNGSIIEGTPLTATTGQTATIRADDGKGGSAVLSASFVIDPAAAVSFVRQIAPLFENGNILTLRYENALPGEAVFYRIAQIENIFRSSATFIIPPALAGQELLLEVRQLNTISRARWTPGGSLTIQKRNFYTTTPPDVATGIDPEPPTPAISSGWIVGQYLVTLVGSAITTLPEIDYRFPGEPPQWLDIPQRSAGVYRSSKAIGVGPGENLAMSVRVRITDFLPETLIDTLGAVTGDGSYTTAYSAPLTAAFVLLDVDGESNEIIETGTTNS